MNSKKCLLALTTMALVFASLTWAADDKDEADINKRIDGAANVLNEIMATPDKAIPDSIMSDARCIAVVPSMIKIAIGIGGNHGKGVATCRTPNGWSAPAPITIAGGSLGLQLGGQAVDLVMVVMNDQGMQHLLSSKFKLGADASAAAGPVVTQDKDETRVLYGKFIPFSEILSGKVEPPRGTEAFLSTVSKYTSQA